MDMKTAPVKFGEFSFKEAHWFIILAFDYFLFLSSLKFKAETWCVRKVIKLKKKVTNIVFF